MVCEVWVLQDTNGIPDKVNHYQLDIEQRWRNGSRAGLRNRCRKTCGFESHPLYKKLQ